MGVPAENITNVYNGTPLHLLSNQLLLAYYPLITWLLTYQWHGHSFTQPHAPAPVIHGCSPCHTRLQPSSPTVAGTDTKKFNRTPEMAVEALKRYPCATPDNAFVVGCIGSYEEGK